MIRTATPDDLALVRELWHAFDAEVPDAEWRDSDSAEDLREVETAIGKEIVLLADDVGLAVAVTLGDRAGMLDMLYVRPKARGKGIAHELVREVAEQLRARGVDMLELEVLASNGDARAIYERWGFAPVELILAAPVDALVERLGRSAGGPTFGSIHVQTDDTTSVERAVQKALPRMGHSEQTMVSDAHNGWVTVRDELCDRDPNVLQRLAKELSYTSGGVVLALGVEEGALVRYTLYDRGAAVDEYASLPEFRGPLPPGEVIALGANPTVVARLTGAEPARVREIARTASSPAELPPALELHAQIAELMGVQVLMLTLYDAARCPYCARVRIVLAEKDVEYEPIEIDLTDRPAWIYEKNSTGRVPVIEEDGWLLPESAVIMEFLEERYPEPRLLAADAADRALARLLIFRHDDFTRPYYALRRGEDGAAARLDAELGTLDAALSQHPWLGGSEYGLADIAYVPWVLRARDLLGVALEAFPAVAAWLERLVERQSIAMEVEVVAAL